MIPRRLLLLTGLLFVTGLALLLAGRASGRGLALTRALEPVVVKGSSIPNFTGVSPNSLFVFAYTGSDWRMVTSQTDEVAASGAYTSTQDGTFDPVDELVFMAGDAGVQAPTGTNPVGVAGTNRYEIRIIDPTDASQQAYAYLFRSTTLAHASATSYSRFSATGCPDSSGEPAIVAVSYTLCLRTDHPGFNYMALNGSGTNILDKLHLRGQVFGMTLDQEALPAPGPYTPISNGPVRVILGSGSAFFLSYGALLSVQTLLNLPFSLDSVTLSVSFSPAASGYKYYDANVSSGVTVDGHPDSVPAMPESRWREVSGGTGTLLQFVTLPGAASNYYVDDASAPSPLYGDNGLTLSHPAKVFTATLATDILPANLGNVGATYQNYLDHPLQTAIVAQDISSGTGVPSATPSLTATSTPVPTDTATPTRTATASPTSTPTWTATATPARLPKHRYLPIVYRMNP